MAGRKKSLEAEAVVTFAAIRFALINEQDPLRYLNQRSVIYIQRLERIADEARANGRPDIELKTVAFLARMSPAYRTKLDPAASPLGLLKPPNLDNLSHEELKQLEVADEHSDLADRLIKEVS